MDIYSPYLEELIGLSSEFPTLGKTEALRLFSDSEFNEDHPVGVRMSAADHAFLEQHVENPFLLREINLKKLSTTTDLCIATFADFKYDQILICSSYACGEITAITQTMRDNWTEWYGLVAQGTQPPIFLK